MTIFIFPKSHNSHKLKNYSRLIKYYKFQQLKAAVQAYEYASLELCTSGKMTLNDIRAIMEYNLKTMVYLILDEKIFQSYSAVKRFIQYPQNNQIISNRTKLALLAVGVDPQWFKC